MNGKKLLSILITISLLFVLSGCSKQTSSKENDKPEVIELRLAHFFPSTHPIETDLIQPWTQAIEKATDGKVHITVFSGGSLLPAAQIYDGVVQGIADMGLSCFAYTRGRFPVLEAFELPGITYKSSKVASKVAWEGINKLNPKEIQDTKMMMILTTGPGDLYTKVPVKNLSDLQGLEIRATGLSSKTLDALGAVPVAMPQSEAYESLSKGIVKGNLGPIEVLKGWRQAEVTEYLTKTPFLYNTLFFVTMNLDKWNSLDSDTQKAIEEVNKKYFEEVASGLWDKQNEAALKWAIEEEGLKVIELSQDEADKWIKLVQPVQSDFISTMDKQGFKGQEILDTVKKLSIKYNQEQ